MKILVTGGAGFVGSHVADRYLAAGHEVVIVDDLSTGRRENINRLARFYRCGICNSVEIEQIFERERPEAVNHHAAQMNIRRSVREPLLDASVNVLGSLTLLELTVRYGVKKFIYASTGGAIYGEPAKVPVEETSDLRPISHYGVSKLAVENYLHVYQRLYGLTSTILRYANVYGPRQNPEGEAGVVTIFALQMMQGKRPTIYGDGSKTRDYVFVENIAEANLSALERGDGEVLNLGWGKEVTDCEIFEAVRRCVSFRGEPQFAPRRPGEVEHIALDARRVRAVLGWAPRTLLQEGIARTVEYLRQRQP